MKKCFDQKMIFRKNRFFPDFLKKSKKNWTSNFENQFSSRKINILFPKKNFVQDMIQIFQFPASRALYSELGKNIREYPEKILQNPRKSS